MGNVTIDNGNGDTITVSGSNNNTIYAAVSKLAPLITLHSSAVGGTNKPAFYAGDVYFVPAFTNYLATDADGAVYAFENKPELSDTGIYTAPGQSCPIGRREPLTPTEVQESLQAL